jgi:hypothetical protein
MPLGVVKIEAKAGMSKGKHLPHRGKEIFIPVGTHVILGRTGIEFSLTQGSSNGIFRFCALPKNELIVKKELRLGTSGKYDLHPYWFTLSVREISTYCRGCQDAPVPTTPRHSAIEY